MTESSIEATVIIQADGDIEDIKNFVSPAVVEITKENKSSNYPRAVDIKISTKTIYSMVVVAESLLTEKLIDNDTFDEIIKWLSGEEE